MRTRAAVTILAVSLAPCLLALGGCTRDYRVASKFEDAAEALREGDPDTAADYYYDAFQVDATGPRAPEALYAYAYTTDFHQKSPALAAEFYRRVVRLFPQSPRAKDALERAATIENTILGHPERAVLDYQRLAELFPDSEKRAEWAMATAQCYLNLGNAAQAEQEVRALLSQGEKLAIEGRIRAHHLLGKIYLVQERPAEAVHVFEELCRMLEGNPAQHAAWLEARFQLAQALTDVDETERALEVYRQIEGEFPRQEIIQEKINFLTIRQQKRSR